MYIIIHRPDIDSTLVQCNLAGDKANCGIVACNLSDLPGKTIPLRNREEWETLVSSRVQLTDEAHKCYNHAVQLSQDKQLWAIAFRGLLDPDLFQEVNGHCSQNSTEENTKLWQKNVLDKISEESEIVQKIDLALSQGWDILQKPGKQKQQRQLSVEQKTRATHICTREFPLDPNESVDTQQGSLHSGEALPHVSAAIEEIEHNNSNRLHELQCRNPVVQNKEDAILVQGLSNKRQLPEQKEEQSSNQSNKEQKTALLTHRQKAEEKRTVPSEILEKAQDSEKQQKQSPATNKVEAWTPKGGETWRPIEQAVKPTMKNLHCAQFQFSDIIKAQYKCKLLNSARLCRQAVHDADGAESGTQHVKKQSQAHSRHNYKNVAANCAQKRKHTDAESEKNRCEPEQAEMEKADKQKKTNKGSVSIDKVKKWLKSRTFPATFDDATQQFDLAQTDLWGFTPLQRACKEVCSCGVKPEDEDPETEDPETKDPTKAQMVEYFIASCKLGQNHDQLDSLTPQGERPSKWAAIHLLAATKGGASLLHQLINAGAQVDLPIPGRKRSNALFQAAGTGCFDQVKILVATKKFSCWEVNWNGRSYADVCRCSNKRIRIFLQKWGAPFKNLTQSGRFRDLDMGWNTARPHYSQRYLPAAKNRLQRSQKWRASIHTASLYDDW